MDCKWSTGIYDSIERYCLAGHFGGISYFLLDYFVRLLESKWSRRVGVWNQISKSHQKQHQY